MGVETFRTHLNSLKELILDENKIVTYVSVSKDFCIHVNESKSLMMEVVDEIKKKQPDVVLNVLYILSGLTTDNKAVTCVCPEGEMDEWRSKIKALFFEHIYSINKGNSSLDKVALMAITKFEDYHLCLGLIKSNLCIKRSSDEIGSLKAKSSTLIDNDQKPKVLKQNKEEKPKEPVLNGNVTKKASENKSETAVKQEKVSPKKQTNKQKQEIKNGGKSKKGIDGFFSRSESSSETNKSIKNKNKEPEVKVKVEDMDVNKDVIVKSEKMDVDQDIKETKETIEKNHVKTTVKAEKMDVDEDIKETKETNNKNHGKPSKQTNGTQKKTKNKSLTDIKKNAKVDKKRKRVLCISDSESDEEKNDPFVDETDDRNEQTIFDSEDEIPPTPTANTIKVSSALLHPRKKRKIVTKTYLDEDGFLMTKKEEVYESLSENEDSKENVAAVVKTQTEEPKEAKKEESQNKTEVSPKSKKTTKNGKKKISPPQKGKQATLMSFFKKA